MLREAQHERQIPNDFKPRPARLELVEERLSRSSLHFKEEHYMNKGQGHRHW